ncbi:MAG: hypothetical protein Q9226_007662 [Calogaya cf. arnoldii]
MEHDLESSAAAHTVCMENLPAEMQAQVLLQIPDVSSLRNLVHASPIFHNVYRARREFFLGTVLGREIRPYARDALATIQASCIDRHVEHKHSFKAFYRKCYPVKRPAYSCVKMDLPHGHEKMSHQHASRSSDRQELPSDPVPWLNERLSFDGILALLRLQRVVSFAVELFCAKALSTHPISGTPVSYAALSYDEDVRIRRAFYRYQTFWTLANPSTQPLFDGTSSALPDKVPKWQDHKQLDMAIAAGGIFKRIPSWELTELICVSDFLVQKYTEVYKKHQNELSSSTSLWRLDTGSHYSSDFVLSDKSILSDKSTQNCAESCLRDGLHFFKRMLLSSSSGQVELLGRHLMRVPHLLDVLSQLPGCTRPLRRGLSIDDSLLFKHNRDHTKRTLGWQGWIAAGIDGSLWNEGMLHVDRFKWGFVFWDEKRLKEMFPDARMLYQALGYEAADNGTEESELFKNDDSGGGFNGKQPPSQGS